MTPPLVSCIVPVFNGECYLRETLESILGQTYAQLEAIVADDGSTDGTRAVVEAFGDRVRYLHQPNAGHASARNLGLAAARGDAVAFLDADDLWHPEKLDRQMTRFRDRPELDACVTFVRDFLSGEPSPHQPSARAEPVPGYSCITLLARRAMFDTVGRFDPALLHGNDTDWFLRAADRGAVVELMPDVLVYRRLHDANRSRLLADASRREYVRIVKASLDRRRRVSR
jgi:glycosyltransferase involved in cell wall biosynthesis